MYQVEALPAPASYRLCKEVEAARLEADDNCKFLKALRKLFEKLNMMDDFQVGWEFEPRAAGTGPGPENCRVKWARGLACSSIVLP